MGEFIGDPGEAGGEVRVLLWLRQRAVHLLPEQQAGAGSGQVLLCGAAGEEIPAGRKKQAAAGVIFRPQGDSTEKDENDNLFRFGEDIPQGVGFFCHNERLL